MQYRTPGDQTGLQRILSWNKRYIERNDDSSVYISIKHIDKCKRFVSTKIVLRTIILHHWLQSGVRISTLKNIRSVHEICKRSLIFSRDNNVHQFQVNSWLIEASEQIHVTMHCESVDAKLLCWIKTPLPIDNRTAVPFLHHKNASRNQTIFESFGQLSPLCGLSVIVEIAFQISSVYLN